MPRETTPTAVPGSGVDQLFSKALKAFRVPCTPLLEAQSGAHKLSVAMCSMNAISLSVHKPTTHVDVERAYHVSQKRFASKCMEVVVKYDSCANEKGMSIQWRCECVSLKSKKKHSTYPFRSQPCKPQADSKRA